MNVWVRRTININCDTFIMIATRKSDRTKSWLLIFKGNYWSMFWSLLTIKKECFAIFFNKFNSIKFVPSLLIDKGYDLQLAVDSWQFVRLRSCDWPLMRDEQFGINGGGCDGTGGEDLLKVPFNKNLTRF